MEIETKAATIDIEQPTSKLDLEFGGDVVKIVDDYEKLKNIPKINDVELIGNINSDDLGIKGVSNYEELENKPKINGKELIGDLSTDDLGIEAGSDVDILTVFDVEKTYEDNQVYNANAIHQLMEIFGFEVMQIMEFVENHEERISALENQ